MQIFLYYVYNYIVIPFMYVAFNIGYFFNIKIKKGIAGRKGLFKNVKTSLTEFADADPRFWIHCSSMGEFEQAKPLIKKLKNKFPGGFIIVSLFSPSALDYIKNYTEADYICYIPFDSRKNARRFISIIKPDAALMVRHDMWPNHLFELKRSGVPAILINSTIHRNKGYNIFYLLWERFLYHNFEAIFTISEETKEYFIKYDITEGFVENIGDTRYDQVVRRAAESEGIVAPLRKLVYNRKVFVAGSTWPTDERVIIEAAAKLKSRNIDMWLILVPHEPDHESIQQIEIELNKRQLSCCRFSELGNSGSDKKDVLIVDKIGILASIYAVSDLSFVGGAFGPGIHNVLEPAAQGKIVVFGPKHHNSFEAIQLKKRGVGFEVIDSEDLYSLMLNILADPANLLKLGNMARQVVNENIGVADRIVVYLSELLNSD